MVIVSTVLVLCIGAFSVGIGSFVLQGVSLCGVVAILLNLLLPKVSKL